MRLVPAALLGLLALPAGTSAAAAADTCPQPGSEIATDRPDVTNSSLVVPKGSFQQENGVNIAARDGGQVFDGTNTRLRLGVAECLEVLVDVPTYFDALSGRASTGFTNVTPAVKWQISPLPGKIDLSAVFGAGLPTGTKAVAGPGVQPYVQFPWSWELGSGWGLSGMLTNFIVPWRPELPLQLRRRLSHHQHPADRFPCRHRPQRQRTVVCVRHRVFVSLRPAVLTEDRTR
jgi:hypothetical protein